MGAEMRIRDRSRWEQRFNDIERDLSDIKASLARVEAILEQAHREAR